MSFKRAFSHTLFIYIAVLTIMSACTKHTEQAAVEDVVESPVVSNDLSNQKIATFAEDAQGHIWIGTLRGLNRYDAHKYHQYFCTDDTLDLPDNQICDLYRDSRGRLWVATVNGTTIYTAQDGFHRIPQDLNNKNAKQILENKDGEIIISYNHQLASYDPDCDSIKLKILDFDPEHTYNMNCFMGEDNRLWAVNSVRIRCYNSSTFVVEDSVDIPSRSYYSYLQANGTLWMSTDDGLKLYDTRRHKFLPTPQELSSHPLLSHDKVSLIHPYGNSSLLLYMKNNGLLLYNFISGSVIHETDRGFPFDVPRYKISCMFTDSQQNLWIGTMDQGYQVVYNYKERFNTDNYLNQILDHKSVTSVAVDHKRNLWIATLMDGLYVYNMDSKSVKQVVVDGERDSYQRVFVDNDDNIWLAGAASIWYADAQKNMLLRCRYNGERLQTEQSFNVFMPLSMAQDAHGTIWIGGGRNALYALKRGDTQLTEIKMFNNFALYISGLLPIGNQEVWVTAFYNPIKSINQSTFAVSEVPFKDAEWQNCIRRSVYIPTAIFLDSRGDVWLGTISNGLLRYSQKTKQLSTVLGTPCRDIAAIEEDEQGNIWVSTQYGLGRYDRTTERFTNYYATDGIGGNQFYDRASCKLPDGTLVFGGTHGLTFFNPMDVNAKRRVALLFEDLKIHNHLARPRRNGNIDKHLSYNPDIHLNHRENGFSISFAALDYSEHNRVHYYYCMDGFDKYWIDAGNNNEAYYANLPAGTYTFRVRAVSNDRSIVETEASVRVIVRPAPWLSWWAWVLYVLFAAAIVAYVVRLIHRIRLGREAVRRAKAEKEQEKRVNKMNMSFFANVSHEFRTPLTMISGPVETLCESPSISHDDKRLLLIVQRSVRRMLRLVNQLMDFNKLENDTLRLSVQRADVIACLQNFADIFSINAKEKGITLTTHGLEDSFTTWIDVDKLDKIVGNLLSNAMKFTPKGGKIDLYFDADAKQMKITVADTGKGIPNDQREKIFERYYQLNDKDSGTYNWGTGIGLYYARSLAVLHHGTLTADNRTDGHGAVFTLLLPTTEKAYSDTEKVEEHLSQTKVFPLSEEKTYFGTTQNGSDDDKKTILVVDDDTEVVHYLNALFEPYYNVVCRFDADSAYQSMAEVAPDIVISDVVMPGKSGYDLCRQLKNDPQLCHIPVILVTAKATTENQVEGLNTGADAYVTKPFDPKYLIALIQSQLKNRENVRRLLSNATQTDAIDENVLAPQDNAFMTKLYKLMEDELANSELDITKMTDLLGISRTKFYYKVKGLTGETPNVFFKTYKLNRAAELINEGNNTVSEIAYMTGFSTLSHFSTSFKKQFGVTPSEYGK